MTDFICLFSKQKPSTDKITLNVVFLYLQSSVSDWSLFHAKSSMFLLYHGENKLIFNETLDWRYKKTTFKVILSVDAFHVVMHQVVKVLNSVDNFLLLFWLHVSPLTHIIQFRANQSLLFLLNAACIAEK
jgi:hypothetical protein